MLPARILDLAPDGCSQCILGLTDTPDSGIKLVEPRPGTRARYLTLSHRWGDSHTLRLTLKTRDTFMRGIPLRSIPKTYCDAIAVTRHLGFRYLWIDALCIVQDDPDDWCRESLRMASIYLNAACTIAAHVASDDDAGFLTKSFAPLAAARVRHGTSYIQDRGWVFQERGLSPRLLHFCAGRVLFEDHAGICTTTSWGSTQGMFHVLREGYAPLEGPKPDLADFDLAPTSWYSVVVVKYSGCKLTYNSDRLPAIAGIARYYGQLDGENRYMFGLWSKTLHVGLLWIARDTRRATQREEANPSWSWTRWPGRVGY
ncbi:heterokaryon incompatibility protein-domain-containing protein, partial [Podospora appendiculata]